MKYLSTHRTQIVLKAIQTTITDQWAFWGQNALIFSLQFLFTIYILIPNQKQITYALQKTI